MNKKNNQFEMNPKIQKDINGFFEEDEREKRKIAKSLKRRSDRKKLKGVQGETEKS